MFYQKIKDYAPEKFKRLTGVSPEVFALMIDALVNGLHPFGRPPKLSLADRLLMVLMYWREYRTYAHIGQTYGLSEATVWRTVKQFEDILIQDKRFHLPGKKVLREPENRFEIVLLDATECPCERPKKKSAALLQRQKEASHPKSAGDRR